MAAPYSGQPLRAAPKVMRIWVAPVEDSEGDLHDQRFIYVTVSPGRWLIEANRMNIQRQFRPVLQIGQSAADAAGDENEPQAQQPQANNPRANARRSAAEAAASRAPAQGGRPDPASQE
jgi:conjugal transfer pilus assembly protein TraV